MGNQAGVLKEDLFGDTNVPSKRDMEKHVKETLLKYKFIPMGLEIKRDKISYVVAVYVSRDFNDKNDMLAQKVYEDLKNICPSVLFQVRFNCAGAKP